MSSAPREVNKEAMTVVVPLSSAVHAVRAMPSGLALSAVSETKLMRLEFQFAGCGNVLPRQGGFETDALRASIGISAG